MRRITTVGLTLLALVAAAVVATTDDHRTNISYLLWKQGIGSDWQHGVQFLNVDREFRLSLIGITREEFGARFPVRRPRNSAPLETLKHYGIAAIDGEWLWDSDWFVSYANGKVRDIQLIKG
jgi:hypothetical protein